MADGADAGSEDEFRLRAESAERQLAEAISIAEQRVIRAELKAEAIRAGMVDLDGLKLMNLKDVTLNDSGEVPGASQLMAALKRSKPWLFGAASSSQAARAPAAQAPVAKLATQMSVDEWRAARADLLKHR